MYIGWIAITKPMKKQRLINFLVALLALGAGASALAQSGFYGGVALRDRGAEPTGVTVVSLPLAWSRFTAPTGDDAAAQRALVFGGYRWRNDLSVEAAFNASDKYALHSGMSGPVGGIGLGLSDTSARSWNADVYTSWEFIRSLSLYGRLGYSQTEARPLFAGASLIPGDPRRQRDGVNYGVGLRYDMTPSLGLRVEYARFTRFAGENVGATLPESDQVSIGVQFRF